MTIQTIVRPQLCFPLWKNASPAFKRLVERLEAEAESAKKIAKVNGLAACKTWFAGLSWTHARKELTHPLSKSWTSNQSRKHVGGPRDTVSELEYFLAVRAIFLDGLARNELDYFVDALTLAWSVLYPGSGSGLRTTRVGLDTLRNNVSVEFCDPSEIRYRLEQMLLAYHNSEIPRTLRAIVAMTGILNTHPFPDGNGRCARALFNAVLGQESGACFSSYVPLKAAMQASDAGFEIRLRDAETNGNWAPLIVYFTTVFRVLAEAHRTAACNERHKIARSDFR